jgi:hypothetical protein
MMTPGKLGMSLAAVAAAASPYFLLGQPQIRRVGDTWTREYSGTLPAAARLRVNGNGPVNITGGQSSRQISYTITVSVAARNEAQARRILERLPVRAGLRDGWAVLNAPGGAAISATIVHAPRLDEVVVRSSNGAVQGHNIDGSFDVETAAGELTADKIRGECSLITRGGDIHVGEVSAGLHCGTSAGSISVKSVGGPAVLETNGGPIETIHANSSVSAHTGAGEIHIFYANGAVEAVTRGGLIIVDKATGLVTARNLAGPVQVGSAAGVKCESNGGGVRLSNVAGPMHVSTPMGSIFASLIPGRMGDSYLATANGDITVFIPSKLAVTVRAVNHRADNLKRIVSDFREVSVSRQATRLVAEGALNGGGPLLEIDGNGGAIAIKRQ